MNDEIKELDDFVKATEEASEEASPSYEEGAKQIYEKSLSLVKEAMKNVKQEILITLPDKTNHICYVMNVHIKPNGECTVDFSTPTESRKAELAEHVENCIKIQIEQVLKNPPKKRWYNLF